jgi:hypothetical protein
MTLTFPHISLYKVRISVTIKLKLNNIFIIVWILSSNTDSLCIEFVTYSLKG